MYVIKDLSPVSLLAISLMIGGLAGGLPQSAHAAQISRPATDIVAEAVRAELTATPAGATTTNRSSRTTASPSSSRPRTAPSGA
jgi:hypothetical protein